MTKVSWKKTRLLPLKAIGTIALAAVVLIAMKYWTTMETLAHQYILLLDMMDYMEKGKLLQDMPTEEMFRYYGEPFVAIPSIRSRVHRTVEMFSVNLAETNTDHQLYKQPTLSNLTGFQWFLNNVSLCGQPEGSTKRLIPVLVHSAVHHLYERSIIRKSWASVRDKYRDVDVRPVFLLGELGANLPNSSAHAKDLQVEQQQFGDLVGGNFIDTYRNLSYKHLMGYKWILNYCPSAPFVLKVDDDVFIDIFNWLDWRDADIQNGSVATPDLYCMPLLNHKASRNETTKWFVTAEDWAEEYYPDYCKGAAYGITVHSIRKIYSVSRVNAFLWVDDAYVTGALRREAARMYGWKPVVTHVWDKVDKNSVTWREFCEKANGGLEHWRKERPFKSIVILDRHNFFDRDMKCLWKKTLMDRNMSGIVEYSQMVQIVTSPVLQP